MLSPSNADYTRENDEGIIGIINAIGSNVGNVINNVRNPSYGTVTGTSGVTLPTVNKTFLGMSVAGVVLLAIAGIVLYFLLRK